MNNNGADRPAHSNSLIIHKFVIHLIESITSRLAMYEIYLSWLVSVAEQAGLNITSETLKTGFLALQSN